MSTTTQAARTGVGTTGGAGDGISRRWVRIIPVALVMYTIAFIDRTNISLALPRISRDLGLDPAQAGNVAGIFYWGYLALQIPGGHLAKYWSPKKFISVLLVFWAVCAVGCGFARTYHEMLILRLLLGVAESGVFPATLILLSHWFSKAERARANALWLLCLPGAVIISSPISGWVLDHWNWRSMLIAEGSLPFLWLIIWGIFIQDHPGEANWLPAAEREQVVATLRAEAGGLDRETSGSSFLSALLRPQVFLLAAVYFCFVAGQMGFLFWLPSAMAAFKGMSSLATGFLFTLPYIAAAIGLLVIGRLSDRAHERRLHAAFTMAFGGFCLLLAVASISHSLVLAFAFVVLSGIGAYGPMGPFWAIPTETLPARIVGSVMGLVNALGNLGAYFAPLIVGYLNKRTGNFHSGFIFLGLITIAGGALALGLRTASNNGSRGPIEAR
ncbi:MAG TPA: MFS transporter [Candidatus Sulfotelmatobacter sp.]|nr:MFS transporter [Candidatus Sulfotelmatobacter sp.]